MNPEALADVPRNLVLIGDARDRLAELPASSVDCIITSPPYYGLRDYGMAAQLGLEADINGWVEELRAVCGQMARVLKPTGALWLNVGDSYSAHPTEGAATKSLLLGPQRLAIALSQDGWIVRNQIIWSKTNTMPHSVRDRLSNRYEVMLLLVRQRFYYFDLDSIRVPLVTSPQRGRTPKRAEYPPSDAAPAAVDLNKGLAALKTEGQVGHPLGKNPSDVWECSTAAFHGGHFASFPRKLITPALLATCPARTCKDCGRAWQKRTQRKSGRLLATGPLAATCHCSVDWRPGLVLDPFIGSGTVALVAEEHQRDWLGIELNPVYAALAERRLRRRRSTQIKNT